MRWGTATAGSTATASAATAPAVEAAPVVVDVSVTPVPDAPARGGVTAGMRRWRVRVGLDGTWSSDALLGVVTCQGSDGSRSRDLSDSHPLAPNVTRVDLDATSASDVPVTQYPRRLAFPRRTLVQTGLNPPGVGRARWTTVNVVGHQVVARHAEGPACDIDIDVPTSARSIRLALVRLEPDAAVGSRMSRVVGAEVALPEPARLIAA